MLAIRKRTLSVLLILAMMASLMPSLALKSEAAELGHDLQLNAPFSDQAIINPDKISLSKENPYETNQSTISISGTATNINPLAVKYRVKKVGTTQIRDEQLTPSVDNDLFTFNNVQLFPGLNEIELYYPVGSESGSTSMITRYVYFIDAPTIHGLEVIATPSNIRIEDFSLGEYNAATFPNNKAIFDRVIRTPNLSSQPNAPSSPIMVQGSVSNADTVTMEGQPAAKYPDRFIVDTSLVGITKGDYDVQFIASNAVSSVNYPYSLAFSNGEPMMLDLKLSMIEDDGSGPSPANIKLDQLQTTNLSGQFADQAGNATNDVTFSGYLYVDNEAEFSSVKFSLQHISDAITTQVSKEISLADLSADPVRYPKLVGDTYTVYYLGNIILDNNPNSFTLANEPGQYRLLVETYNEQLPAQLHRNSQTYGIHYTNESLPYIKNVTKDGTALNVNPLITRIGQELVVEVGGTADQVEITSTMLSSTYSPASNMGESIGDHKYVLRLDQLRPGIQTFTITATDTGATPVQQDKQEFFVEAILTPSVKLMGLSSDERFETSNIDPFIVEYVNLVGSADRSKTKITLNGRSGRIHPDDPADLSEYFMILDTKSPATCTDTACLASDSFMLKLNSEGIIAGKNELKFVLSNNAITTERTFVFYYLASDAPYIDVYPADEGNSSESFLTELGNSYTTTEGEVYFHGVVANAKEFVIEHNNKQIAHCIFNNNVWDKTKGSCANVTFNSVSGTDSWEFTVSGISLILENLDGSLNFNAMSTFTFKVYKVTIDTTPLSVSSITIARSPAAYDPDKLTKSFLDKGVINRNYLPFTIDTDGATSVTVNKIPMKQVDVSGSASKRIRYHLDVPLKNGTNKLNIEVVYPGMTVKDTLQILSTTVNQPGAAQKDVLGKNTKFKMFNGDLLLNFNKGTLIKQADPYFELSGSIAQIYNEVPLFFGVAVPETGLVLEENKGQLGLISMMRNQLTLPTQYALASELFWIDAGLIEDGPSIYEPGPVEGGKAPFSMSGGTTINFRYYPNNSHKVLEPTEEGELTLSYDPDLRIEARQLLTVMYNDGHQWVNLGGHVDSKKGTITVPFKQFGYYTVMRLKESFVDVNSHDWARDDINVLKARGWMRELSPTLFGTGSFATRGELATILVKALDLQLDYEGEMTFRDVLQYSSDSYGRWDYRYIETAARKGIVIGGTSNLFAPDDPITRQDVAVMIARAMNLKLSSNEKAKDKMVKTFIDGASINQYAYASIEAVVKKGIMQGMPGPQDKTLQFAPLSYLTRAELATMTVRTLRDLKRLE